MTEMEEDALIVIQKVHRLFKEKGLTLSVAESCTGGLISHYITYLPGASIFFRAGIVLYSVGVKKRILGVPFDVISEYGVVSEETAKEMAERVRLLTGTDFGLSTTGNLGPDVLEGKEKGLVYVAVSKESLTVPVELTLRGSREENKESASLSALRLLVQMIQAA
jgi:PncC family amidohydrolase